MKDRKLIMEEILNYNSPFSYVEMINYLEFLGFDVELSNSVFEELYDNNLIYYEKVLDENLGNQGFAFITDAYINKMIKEYASNKLKEINIEDEKVLNAVIDIASHVRNNPYMKTKTR